MINKRPKSTSNSVISQTIFALYFTLDNFSNSNNTALTFKKYTLKRAL